MAATITMEETMATIYGMLTLAQIKTGDALHKERYLIFVACDDGIVVIGYNPKTPLKRTLKILREMCAENGFKKEQTDLFIAEARRNLTSRPYALHFMIPMPSTYPFPLAIPNTKQTLPKLWNRVGEFAEFVKSSGIRVAGVAVAGIGGKMRKAKEETHEEESFTECEDCGKADSSVGLAPALANDKIISINLCEDCDNAMTSRFEAEGYVYNNENGEWELAKAKKNMNPFFVSPCVLKFKV